VDWRREVHPEPITKCRELWAMVISLNVKGRSELPACKRTGAERGSQIPGIIPNKNWGLDSSQIPFFPSKQVP
jgi:hypothetical protein